MQCCIHCAVIRRNPSVLPAAVNVPAAMAQKIVTICFSKKAIFAENEKPFPVQNG